jgi:HD-like signal output (HDOD) protein
MIDQPLPSLDAWVERLGQLPIPVLRRTARELDDLRVREESVTGRDLARVVLQDPLMAVKVLAYIEAHRRRSQNADITTIDRAIMMLGITPFFRSFVALPVVEDHLRAQPPALLGMLRVVARARRAAFFARDWAALRHDLDIDEITVAALLHDIAEILLWCFAPTLSLRVRQMQEADRALRSQDAQREVYGVTGIELQGALCQAWHLPQLLQILMNDAQAANPRVRNVVYAVNLARHSINGWSDPALPDDFAAIADLLHLTPEAVMMRVGVDPYLAGTETEIGTDVSRSSAG